MWLLSGRAIFLLRHSGVQRLQGITLSVTVGRSSSSALFFLRRMWLLGGDDSARKYSILLLHRKTSPHWRLKPPYRNAAQEAPFEGSPDDIQLKLLKETIFFLCPVLGLVSLNLRGCRRLYSGSLVEIYVKLCCTGRPSADHCWRRSRKLIGGW
jgi:hypothetical protein